MGVREKAVKSRLFSYLGEILLTSPKNNSIFGSINLNYMNRLRFLRFLFVLFIMLTVIFGIGLIVPENRDNALGRIGLWCGFIAMLVDAGVMFTEIRREKKEQDS